ncbi:dienelactone hydrolase family protein [Croceicoccus naphthovorans]|uniref:Dienelactone hydrolase domain-containing protein n=1 Tax=Croceicoccus naphthovorans TaxID=1348774 RepID=A0A0G3XEN6_9SPHN|nr:dienelactone hydrolase family protein [Croceicoccus naphthovorans]AKM09044.1 hypothetical protein AB433_02180 [Croceicoccus naphthovorans]MBB3991455.1 carboxymethylenebutenolidase [Croceicoccus naphthovorans]
MCDQEQLARFARGYSRRDFSGVIAAAGGSAILAACNATDAGVDADPSVAAVTGGGVLGGEVAIPTATGTMGGWFYHPASGNHPAVIMWPDIAGVRPASKAMGERLAAEGFAVIVPDPYWRDEGHAMFQDFADFAQNGGFQTVTPWRDRFSADTVMADTASIVAWLDDQDVVDTSRGIGARGHCMTGSWTIYAAHGSPERVKVAGSMHGGGLVTDAATSPHKMIVPTASYLIAIAQDDAAKEPGAEPALKTALAEAGASGTVDVYAGNHGWTVPDSPAYDKPEAERAYAAFLSLVKAM